MRGVRIMINLRLMLTTTTLAGTTCLALMVNRAAAEEPKKPAVVDRPKKTIERPTELLVGRAMPGALADGRAPGAAFVNPKVAPGKVQWRASFAAACEAAQKSGRPVLLFQLLGQLDQQFT